MDDLNGFDLLNKFQELDISINNLNVNLFHAWFDTDCKDTVDFLSWLCLYLGKENTISATELEEYKELSHKGVVFTGEAYDAALDEVERNFDCLLDVDDNELEVECLKEEKILLLEEEAGQEITINTLQKLNSKLIHQIHKEDDQEMKLAAEEGRIKENCLQMCQQLDETNIKLHVQIEKYGDRLNDFEYTNNPTFICNMSLDDFNQYHNNVISYISLFMKRERECLCKLGAALKHGKKKLEDCFEEDNELYKQLNFLELRIWKSMCKSIYSKVKEEQLEAEIKYMKDLNINELFNVNLRSTQFHLEASLYSKQERIERIFFDFESIIKQAAKNYCDRPKLYEAKIRLQDCRDKLDHLRQIDEKIAKLASYHALVETLFLKERDDIKETDKFFKNVHSYISHNLDSCQARIESMLATINDHRLYCSIPIEQKYKLVRHMGNLLLKEQSESYNLQVVLETLKNLQFECASLTKKIIYDGSVTLRLRCANMEKHVLLLKEFLCDGPTNQAVIIPYRLLTAFDDVDTQIKCYKKAVHAAMDVINKTDSKLEADKWLRTYRLLWMYFLTEPNKITIITQQLEAEVKRKWIESIK